MDDELLAARRAVIIDPRDRYARARVALLECRQGDGVALAIERDALVRVLTSPWVSTDNWGAVRVGFREIILVRPGLLHMVQDYKPWMSVSCKESTACLAGRSEAKDEHSTSLLGLWLVKLMQWAEGECATLRNPLPNQLGRSRPGSYRELGNSDEVLLHRTKEIWSLEHVRIACGVDPVEPEQPTPVRRAATRIGRCHKCSSSLGRMRDSGSVLCYDCNIRGT